MSRRLNLWGDKWLLPVYANLMDILTWVLLGLIAGVLGKFLLPGKDPGGWIMTILLGIGGAFFGGWVGGFMGMGTVGGLNLASIVTATVGAILLLVIFRILK